MGDVKRVLPALLPQVEPVAPETPRRVPGGDRRAGGPSPRRRRGTAPERGATASSRPTSSSARSARPPATTPRSSPTWARTRCGPLATPASAGPNSHISSGGLGTMGFGLPAAMGAAIGRPGQGDVGDRRRRRPADDRPGADDPRPGPHPGQDRPARQPQAGHGPAVAGARLRRQLPLRRTCSAPTGCKLAEAYGVAGFRATTPGGGGAARSPRPAPWTARPWSISRSPRSRTSSR